MKRFIPAWALRFYHRVLATVAAFWYGNPSKRMVVIGVTGTNGKSSTTQFIGQMLESLGCRVGWTTTASFKISDREWVNDKKMTMLGRFDTQRLLHRMAEAGCTHVIVETSSQGIEQFRHVGINYDVVVFTNLTPEHIEAHGGFEAYKQAKGKLFAHTARSPRKTIMGRRYEKTAIVNADDAHATYFASFGLDRLVTFDLEGGSAKLFPPPSLGLSAHDLGLTVRGSSFTVEGVRIDVSVLGRFNVYNALAAVACVRSLGFSTTDAVRAAQSIRPVPGRLESIDEGQPFGVMVDYSYEPVALAAAYEAVRLLHPKRLIHIVGSAGGGRDTARRFELGKLSAQMDDVTIVTNEDPYDEDPQVIIDQVAEGALRSGKVEGVSLHRILDRQEAINKAVSLAQPGDLVFITGKGSEPVMAVANGKKIPWDDRVAARRALATLSYAH